MQNLDEILKAAQNVQAELQKAQDSLDSIEVQGIAGGGLVKVRASAKGRIIGLDIDPTLLKPDDKQMLEDLITAAFNDAREKVDIAEPELPEETEEPAVHEVNFSLFPVLVEIGRAHV